jgi:hypothetical protein
VRPEGLCQRKILIRRPVFGDEAARNWDGRGIVCGQESKLMKTLLHRQ